MFGPIYEIDVLGLCFTLLSVDNMPEDWADLAMDVKKNRKGFIQFFKPGCLVSELVPFLAYNVSQAFKYEYNMLKGFEPELLVALYGKRGFQEASYIIGVSASQQATVLIISGEPEELNKAASVLKDVFSKKGASVKQFQDDRSAFTSFWRSLLSREIGVEIGELDYYQVLSLVKERIAMGYV